MLGKKAEVRDKMVIERRVSEKINRLRLMEAIGRWFRWE